MQDFKFKRVLYIGADVGCLPELFVSVVPCRDKVLLLNKTTEVINFWQDEEKKHTLQEAQEKFPECKFQGT